MQTNFTPEALADPQMQASEKILRSCVHCGFCTATCPTYLLGGDELDSPRGRIYLIKDMLENQRPASAREVLHIDRCLSCLACMTTCPSGVNYMHLIDHARAYVEATYKRPLADRLLRTMLAKIMPSRRLFSLALRGARLARPLAPMLARVPHVGPKLAAMVALAPKRPAPREARRQPGEYPAPQSAAPRRRVALLAGCVQSVLTPGANAAAIRLLNRCGVDVVLARNEKCCGSVDHHMGREAASRRYACATIDAWDAEIQGKGLEAILMTASGCGTTIKDYGFTFRDDPAYAAKAARVAALTKDITEFLAPMDLPFATPQRLTVAYHAACSLQHGQKILDAPKALLRRAGFTLREPAESHICCGSAGTYNMLQPEISAQLRARKLGHIAKLKADVVAAGNLGCITQLSLGATTPVVHTIELLDWACGGPAPQGLPQQAPAAEH